MNTNHITGSIVAGNGVSEQRTLNETYRVSVNPEKDRLAYTAIVSLLTQRPDKDAQRANMFMLHKHADTLAWFRKLTPEQLDKAAPEISKVFKVIVDLKQLQNVRQSCQQLASLRNKQMEQCRWLVSNNARNNMIQSICFLITENEIRQIRNEMNIQTQVGRAAALPVEDQLTVQQVWQQLVSEENDEFKRYHRLQEKFPEYDLGRLNAAINGI